METWKKTIAVSCLLALLLAAGCREQGTMESAGEAVDQMVQDAEDSVKDAVSHTKRTLGFHEPGPMEELLGEKGRFLDEAIWAAEDFLDTTLSEAKNFLDGKQ